MTFSNGSFIFADSQAQGDGGNITITVGEQILLEGFSFFNDDPDLNIPLPSQILVGLSSENADGTGGNILIEADSLVLNEAASISSNTVLGSSGTAGSVAIDVDRLQITENSLINVFTGNEDAGGAITVEIRTLDLTNGGKILAATTGGGDAGDINLNVSEQIQIDNNIESSVTFISDLNSQQFLNPLQAEPSGIYANAIEGSTGAGGDVNIGTASAQTLRNFVIRNDGTINVSSNGEGSGGNISLKSQSLELDNGANITASTRFGQGGIINLEIDTGLTLDGDSSISAEAFQDANGGNISIDTQFLVGFADRSSTGNDIIANAEAGQGGIITIAAEGIFGFSFGPSNDPQDSTNTISASSSFDGDGVIETFNINSVGFDYSDKIIPADSTQTIAEACLSNKSPEAKSVLAVEGQGGITPEPGLPLNSNQIIGAEGDSTSAIPAPIETERGKIQLARGVEVAEDGTIVLTAYRTNNAGDRLPEIKPNCG